jgi:hypothetical protein
LEAHATRWSRLADACEADFSAAGGDEAAYSTTLSMFYNWLDGEASTVRSFVPAFHLFYSCIQPFISK